MKTYFDMKGCAPGLVLKRRVQATRTRTQQTTLRSHERPLPLPPNSFKHSMFRTVGCCNRMHTHQHIRCAHVSKNIAPGNGHNTGPLYPTPWVHYIIPRNCCTQMLSLISRHYTSVCRQNTRHKLLLALLFFLTLLI